MSGTDQRGQHRFPAHAPASGRADIAYEDLIEAGYLTAEVLDLRRADLAEHGRCSRRHAPPSCAVVSDGPGPGPCCFVPARGPGAGTGSPEIPAQDYCKSGPVEPVKAVADQAELNGRPTPLAPGRQLGASGTTVSLAYADRSTRKAILQFTL